MGCGQGTIQPRQARRELRAGSYSANRPACADGFDAAHSETEERWFTLGMSSEGKLLAVAHTYQPTQSAKEVRIISAREATRREREQYANEPR